MTVPDASMECHEHEYKCYEGQCIHKEWICDGTEDCPQGDDEAPSCRKLCILKIQTILLLFSFFNKKNSITFIRKLRRG